MRTSSELKRPGALVRKADRKVVHSLRIVLPHEFQRIESVGVHAFSLFGPCSRLLVCVDLRLRISHERTPLVPVGAGKLVPREHGAHAPAKLKIAKIGGTKIYCILK